MKAKKTAVAYFNRARDLPCSLDQVSEEPIETSICQLNRVISRQLDILCSVMKLT